MKLKTLLIILTLATVLLAPEVFAKKLPIEDFFQKPRYTQVQLSPNGKQIGVLAPIDGRLNVVVIDLETKKPTAVTSLSDQDVTGFLWATDERILFFMDFDGNESFGIFAINTDGSKAKTLVEPARGTVGGSGRSVVRVASVIDVLRDDPDYVLVSYNKRRASFPDVYRLNIWNGRDLKIVENNPGDVTNWFTDWDGRVVGGIFTDELINGFKIVNPETDEWELVHQGRFDEPSISPAGLKADGINGYVNSWLTPDGNPRDKAGLYEYNFIKKEFGKLVYEHDRVDCCGLVSNRKKKDMIGVAFQIGIPETIYLDEEWKSRMSGIDQALPDTINVMSSLDEEETVGVVVAYSSKQPAEYYLYDFEKNTLEFLAQSRPWIKPEEMAETKSFEFTSRDGKPMQGYLTLPAGSDGKNLPMVMHPHGGPWARDGWGYNPAIQFLANRGYAVLQVNFRGSTGFGREHLISSFKQWGQTMQNDITDGVQWAIDQGIADQNRICIYGGSYGGYATMAGLTYTPDLYKCGINYVGVTDLPLLFKTMPDAWNAGKEQMKQQVGDPDTEKEFLEQWSPSNHADKIKVPVFMAYGLMDPRVNIKHAHVMEDAMKDAGVRHELMVKKKEGHGFRRTENQIDFFGRMETFLAENLQPGSAAVTNP